MPAVLITNVPLELLKVMIPPLDPPSFIRIAFVPAARGIVAEVVGIINVANA